MQINIPAVYNAYTRCKKIIKSVTPVRVPWSCMLIAHNDHNNTIQVYSRTVMTHVIALEAGQSSHGTFKPITPVLKMKFIMGIDSILTTRGRKRKPECELSYGTMTLQKTLRKYVKSSGSTCGSFYTYKASKKHRRAIQLFTIHSPK